MAAEQMTPYESRQMRRRRCRLMCLYGCLHACRLRDLVINNVAFKPPSRRGYAIDKYGTFLLKKGHGPHTGVSSTLGLYGIDLFHTFLRGARNQRISVIVMRHRPRSGDEEEDDEPRVREDRELIVFSHGNSTDIGYMFTAYVNLCKVHDVDLLAYDYSGYGLSDGSPGERVIYENIEAVYEYARRKLKVLPEHIVLYGNSLGSAPSCYLASMPEKYPIGGLVLDAPLASAIRLQVGHVAYTPKFDAFTNVEYLKTKSLYPTLIIHGTVDSVIPVQQARELAFVVEVRHAELMQKQDEQVTDLTESDDAGRLSPSDYGKRGYIELTRTPEDYLRTWWVPGAGHNNIQVDNMTTYNRNLDIFFKICRRWRNDRKLKMQR
ncbi:alpha/beta hydrolase fold domain containiing protein, putative [Babesia bigemina]|uniref:Alpha/beta hydrolase fold domain containiing protein, putative n=1 Tax=Babesia bigemina TaxID=5866 RepID=A0A061D8C5_BABBI|nr:alpha/beta hydrolase fold domain containiing protein, putative [Babesia bigemina]CDR96773.1 alpha/beta hydrolase fold domain containiing protein, putative [Babesia bigemina]|eukprot:XP_012768959.1 alpha/beta hydrolase fold domain containiing protein, putative [Babesia bigemina]